MRERFLRTVYIRACEHADNNLQLSMFDNAKRLQEHQRRLPELG